MVFSSTLSPTPLEVLRYRYHHGANLGSCFVLERWLTPSMYPQGADTSELAAVTASIDTIDFDLTKAKWEAHWANMISDADLDWLVNVAHCTSVRLPIGYWDLGPAYCKNTAFSEVSPVYMHAISALKSLVTRFYSRGIGTLVDLHGLPGGANGGDHSGTNSGQARLWGDASNLDLATNCVHVLAQNIADIDGVIGLQLCNEAAFEAPGMYDWYDRVLQLVSQVDAHLPVYISDAWDIMKALEYVQSKNSLAHADVNPLIIDTHYYWAFSDADKAKTPAQIIGEIPSKLSELEGKDGDVCSRGAAQVVVGEYSCVMDESSWSKSPNADRATLVMQFGQEQSKRWQQRSGGSYFWTYYMDWMDGGEWGFVEQTKKGAVTAPLNLTFPIPDIQGRVAAAQGQRPTKRSIAAKANRDYWDAASPGKTFEHWRFETGWELGYSDAMSFFVMRSSGQLGKGPMSGGDKIGCLDVWVRKRILESGMSSEFTWQFEHGLRQGIQGFYEAARV